MVQCLVKIVPEGQLTTWLPVRDIKAKMTAQFEEGQDWLTSKWIGSALRRLGFTDKRRVGTGYEYNMARATIEELKKRMQITETVEEEEEPPKSCWICKLALPRDHENTTMLDGKEVHVPCFKQTQEGRND